jgi:hypothetical protein
MSGQFVRLCEHTLALTATREHPARLTSLFTRARSETGHAWCLCTDPPLRLVIRMRDGRYHLARWPGEGELHHSTCLFHALPDWLSGRAHYVRQAIEETATGTKIRLQTALQTREGASTTRPLTELPSSPATPSRRSVTLLGMLHWLAEHARLNTWQPGEQRAWPECHQRLKAAIADGEVNGQELSRLLYVVPPFRRDRAALHNAALRLFLAHLAWTDGHRQRGLILGEIKSMDDTRYGHRIMLRHLATPLYLTTPLLHRVQRSYRSAFAAASGRALILGVAERTPTGNLRLVDLAAMLVNRVYIPADSSYELMMADHLIAHQRAFTQPLRYDGIEEVFPDFILTDAPGPAVYVEVYGMPKREAYEARKRAKQAHYQQARLPVVEWDITSPLPILPRSDPSAGPGQELPPGIDDRDRFHRREIKSTP